jgi:hypothetical protein
MDTWLPRAAGSGKHLHYHVRLRGAALPPNLSLLQARLT